jgi:hypothetical protein
MSHLQGAAASAVTVFWVIVKVVLCIAFFILFSCEFGDGGKGGVGGKY